MCALHISQIINVLQSSLFATRMGINLHQELHFKENISQSAWFFSVFFQHSSTVFFNTEFNYAEHLSKRYLTANYSVPWKPLANKLAMLMWECLDIFGCAYKGSRSARAHTHTHTTPAFWAIVDWWIRLDLIWELKKTKNAKFQVSVCTPSSSDKSSYGCHHRFSELIIVRNL